MNRKIAVAIFALPVEVISLLPKSARAQEITFPPEASQTPVVVAQRYDQLRDRDQRESARREEARREEARREEARREEARREATRREEARREAIRREAPRRVWIPGHWESGFLGIGRKWVEGHWEER